MCSNLGAVSEFKKNQKAAALSGGSPSPQVLVTNSTYLSCAQSMEAKEFISKTWTLKSCFKASAAVRFARPSAVPVWLPNKISNLTALVRAFGVTLADSLLASANNPAKNPLSQARWSAVKGALSGMQGMGRIFI